jgi:MOSC domain-containing protein YiiM
MTHLSILGLYTGKSVPFRGAEPSAIAKRPVADRRRIGPLGIEGDEQADPSVHGGPDKAIHHYPYDHYPAWRAEIGSHPLLDAPGGFGENIATSGLTEAQVCLGDRFRLGSALVEIAQGRQPCWKIGHHFGRAALTARVVETGRCGWYYRVIEAGEVGAGDGFELVERGLPQWSVSRMFALLVAGGHGRDRDGLRELAGLPVLAEPWRARAVKLLG